MKHCLKPIFALAVVAILTATSVQAHNEEKMVIALNTDGFELAETDISSMAIGEGKTIETKDGKLIDILRTPDGAEIYIDGELLDMNFNDEGLHEELMIRKQVEIICDSEDKCEQQVVIHVDDDSEISEFVTADGKVVVIHKEIEISCTSDNDETSCSDKMVWISDGDEIDFGELHEAHANEEIHKIIVISTETVTED